MEKKLTAVLLFFAFYAILYLCLYFPEIRNVKIYHSSNVDIIIQKESLSFLTSESFMRR